MSLFAVRYMCLYQDKYFAAQTLCDLVQYNQYSTTQLEQYYLTIIPPVHVGYEMEYSQWDA